MNQVSRIAISSQAICPDQIHTFLLRPLLPSSSIKKQVVVNFIPSLTQFGNQVGVIPKYNKDLDCCTPAFILNLDKAQIESNTNLLNFNFQQKSNSEIQQTPQIVKQLLKQFEPKPQHQYCQVCKQSYDDYIKHIEHKIHKKNIQNAYYTKEIYNLIGLFSKDNLNKDRISRQNSQSFELKPRKKRIIQNNLTYRPMAIKLSKDISESTTNCNYSNQISINKENKNLSKIY